MKFLKIMQQALNLNTEHGTTKNMFSPHHCHLHLIPQEQNLHSSAGKQRASICDNHLTYSITDNSTTDGKKTQLTQ